MNENLRAAGALHNRTVRDKIAEVRRLEIANAELVKRCAEYERKYVIASTLMRRFARLRGLSRWLDRTVKDDTGYAYTRTIQQHDRFSKALVDKPWEVVTDL
jgi:hypothetical protein